ncbi:hypothetical protein PC119_g6875 [Phytophthora cactorum]|nr:hypothetical protein PC119_g6875 [Phytophthora cactorum]
MPEGYLFTSSNTTSGSGSRRRLLTSDSASTESSKLLSSSKTSASPSSSDDSTLTNVTDSTYTVKINKEERLWVARISGAMQLPGHLHLQEQNECHQAKLYVLCRI